MKKWLALLIFFCLPSAFASDNILLIIADDLGVDNVGAYAESTSAALTPNIDALAASGLLFRNAWSNPVCSPTRAGIYSGRHGFRTGVGDIVTSTSTNVLSLDEFILPQALAQADYATALIGKWHVGNDLTGGENGPNDSGWDYYAGLLTGALDNYEHWPRTEQGITQTSDQYATTVQVDDALNWIGQQSGPWFCTLAFTAPHTPFHAPPDDLHTVDLTDLDPDTEPTPFYKAAVEAMDTEIGRLLTSLGDLSQTHIIFIGDNGTPREVVEAPFQPTKAKGTVFEGGVNIPFIINGPEVASPGTETTHLAHTVDLYATIIELAGLNPTEVVPADTVLDAVSLTEIITNTGEPPFRYLYTEVFNTTTDKAAVRGKRYKLIRDQDQEALYDLVQDPWETTNLLEGDLSLPMQRTYTDLSAVLDDPATAAAPTATVGNRGTKIQRTREVAPRGR